MNKHFKILLVGTSVFVCVFLWQAWLLPYMGFDGQIMVCLSGAYNAARVIVLYAAFLVLVFGHHHLAGKDEEKKL